MFDNEPTYTEQEAKDIRAEYHQQVLDSTPGRYEGEPDYTPYFYDLWLNEDSGIPDNMYEESGTYATRYEIDSDLSIMAWEHLSIRILLIFTELRG